MAEETEPWERLGKVLRENRLARGYSRKYLAQSVSKDISTVTRWEKGERRPKQASLLILSRLLDIKIQTLQALAGHTPEFDWLSSLSARPGTKEDILQSATESEKESLRQYLHYLRFTDQVQSRHD
ncbi:MAG: helix-turn-helix transcriptional regulator [Chloroflexi bacterium]|nr:helix-turn-helix transcriptional regulator [Chloroflexota bacterium]